MIIAIAITLFVILCPCVSYIIIKQKIIPWNGGVMLVKEDGGYIPINFSEYVHIIGDVAITGLFLPGARAHSLPDVQIGTFTKDSVYYKHVEKDGGVYVMFNQVLKSQRSFLLYVTAAYPWKGKLTKNNPNDDGYYKHVEIRDKKLDF
jgi:hypothetical protein